MILWSLHIVRLTFALMNMFWFTCSFILYYLLWNSGIIYVSFLSFRFYSCKKIIFSKLELHYQDIVSTASTVSKKPPLQCLILSGEKQGIVVMVLALQDQSLQIKYLALNCCHRDRPSISQHPSQIREEHQHCEPCSVTNWQPAQLPVTKGMHSPPRNHAVQPLLWERYRAHLLPWLCWARNALRLCDANSTGFFPSRLHKRWSWWAHVKHTWQQLRLAGKTAEQGGRPKQTSQVSEKQPSTK